MIPAAVLWPFFGASLLLALTPGPDILYVLSQAMTSGRKAGWMVTLGLGTGLLVQTAAVTLGVAVIFRTSELAFTALKFCGAGYLLWLAWQALRSAAASLPSERGGGLSAGQLYRRGILMNVTNPKVAIFFMAFLPPFADPARGPLTLQLAVLGLVFIAAALLVFGGVIMLAERVGAWLCRVPGVQKVMNGATGVIFVGLAVVLAMTHH